MDKRLDRLRKMHPSERSIRDELALVLAKKRAVEEELRKTLEEVRCPNCDSLPRSECCYPEDPYKVLEDDN